MDIIKRVCAVILNPFKIFSLVFEYPIFVGTLFFGVLLIKLFFKFIHTPYTNNQDMRGKTVLITGATIGTGRATAFNLAKRNARVLLACRNVEKGRRVAEEIKSATGNQNVIVKFLDLCSFASVRQCAKSVLETEDRLDVLINNACILADPRKVTEDGCEIVMQTNHLGPFLLTLLLLDLLKRSCPSRIINVTSDVLNTAKLDVEDLKNTKGRNELIVYSNSKLANTLFTKALSKRLLGTGVTVNCVYPGLVPTEMFELNKAAKALLFLMGRTYEEAAQTVIMLAVDPSVEKITGKYFQNCLEADYFSKDCENTMLAERLFEISERTVGVSL